MTSLLCAISVGRSRRWLVFGVALILIALAAPLGTKFQNAQQNTSRLALTRARRGDGCSRAARAQWSGAARSFTEGAIGGADPSQTASLSQTCSIFKTGRPL